MFLFIKFKIRIMIKGAKQNKKLTGHEQFSFSDPIPVTKFNRFVPPPSLS